MSKLSIPNVSAEQAVYGLAALAVGFMAWKVYQAGRAVAGGIASGAEAVGDFADRRLHDANLASSVANGFTEVVTLDRNQTLGGAIFDLFHRTTADGRVVSIFEDDGDVLEPLDVDAIGERRL